MAYTKYTVGFVFSNPADRVLLIKKNRPEWQAGRLNGVGGHIEKGESPVKAMMREFEEETGLKIPEDKWYFKVTHFFNDCVLYIFMAQIPDLTITKSTTDERLKIVLIKDIPTNTEIIPNLKWIIPLIWDPYINLVDVNPDLRPRGL